MFLFHFTAVPQCSDFAIPVEYPNLEISSLSLDIESLVQVELENRKFQAVWRERFPESMVDFSDAAYYARKDGKTFTSYKQK